MNLNIPINTVSFGQISTLILRSLFDKSNSLDKIKLFPIGNVELGSQSNIDDRFIREVNLSIQNAFELFNRKEPIFKLWHLNGSIESYSDNQTLLSFYELDSPTKTEQNVIRNNKKVLFSSKYTVDIFKNLGINNVEYLPLAFDKYNFSRIDKLYFSDRITFNLVGKMEKRKHHLKVLKAWAKKYGNNNKYSLQCSIFNPFISPQDQETVLNQTLEGKRYFNISFLPFQPHNSMYNDYLNSADIVIGMSGGEGWGLPEFHSIALGKYGVILNAHGYKSWANKDNAILVEPLDKKIPAEDGIFFKSNTPYNQGNIFDFDEDDFISGCELAITKVKSNKVNENGIKLQKDFSSEKLIDNIQRLSQ